MKLRTTLAIGAATFVAISSLAAVSYRKGVERDWQTMVARIDAFAAERLAAPAERGALYGEATSDAAWPYYKRAIEELRGIDDFLDRAREAPYAETEDEVVARDALLIEAEPVLVQLRRGAHARDVTSPIDWSKGLSARIQKLTEVRPVTELAVASLIASVESGDDVRGIEVLLDAQQFGRDLAVSPSLIEEMIGVSTMVPTAAVDFLADEDAPRLSTEAKEVWLDGLDALEASLPEGSAAFRGEVELLGRHFLRLAESEDVYEWRVSDRHQPGWRYGFSWRAAIVDYMGRASDIALELEGMYGQRPPADVLRYFEERERGWKDDPNPLFDLAMPKVASAAKSRYWNLARLSYLRHALALDLGRTPDEPLDPFGNGVQVEVSDDRIRVWTEVEPRNPNKLEIVLLR